MDEKILSLAVKQGILVAERIQQLFLKLESGEQKKALRSFENKNQPFNLTVKKVADAICPIVDQLIFTGMENVDPRHGIFVKVT